MNLGSPTVPQNLLYNAADASVYRFVQHIKPAKIETTVRVERKPGEEAQVDFGYAGMMLDPETGKLRKAWAFVMTLYMKTRTATKEPFPF